MMRTTIDIDNDFITEIIKISSVKNKKINGIDFLDEE
jgi:Arc/MetJ family transcription regulator